LGSAFCRAVSARHGSGDGIHAGDVGVAVLDGGPVPTWVFKDFYEICPGSGHAGANGAWWACAYFGCLLVGQTQQLGEHEGFSSLWSKASQGIGHSDLLPNVVYHLPIYRKSG